MAYVPDTNICNARKLESEGLRLSPDEPYLESSSEAQNEMLYFNPQSQIETPDGSEPNVVLNEVYQRREQVAQSVGPQQIIQPPAPKPGMPSSSAAYNFPLPDRNATLVAGNVSMPDRTAIFAIGNDNIGVCVCGGGM